MTSPEIVEEGAEGTQPVQPKSKKKLIIIGAAAGVLVLGGGGGAAMMLSGGSAKAETPAEGGHGEAPKEAEGASGGHGGEAGSAESYVDVPAMVVNLRSPDGASRYLKLHFMIVPGAHGSPEGIKEKLPLILDAYQPFLRELRPEDLAGSAAVFRIKEEMLVRATQVAGEGVVKDILIQDLVQQ